MLTLIEGIAVNYGFSLTDGVYDWGIFQSVPTIKSNYVAKRGQRLIMYGLNKEQSKLAANFQIEDFTHLHKILKSCYGISAAAHKINLKMHQAPE